MRALFGMLVGGVLLATAGCTGPGLFERQSWLFGKDPPDDPAVLARIGPTPNQRIALVRTMGEKMKASPAEAERLSTELVQRIQNEQDPLVRAEIVKMFGEHPTGTGAAVLKAGLNYPGPDPDPEVRGAICRAWAKIGGDDARTMLSAALANDRDVDVRVQAAKSLGQFKDAGNMQALAGALEDTDIAVQHTAMQSMKAVSGRDYGENAQQWSEYAKSGAAGQETPSIAGRIWPWNKQ
jgi:hypothetical protein